MEYMLTFLILNVYVDKTQPRQFKFTFKSTSTGLYLGPEKRPETAYPFQKTCSKVKPRSVHCNWIIGAMNKLNKIHIGYKIEY